jgi:hypothetical protein
MTKESKTSLGLKVTAAIKIRAPIYTRMFDIAKEHRDIAKQIEGKNRVLETKESMITILFAYTTLEAYINTIGTDFLDSVWSQTNKINDPLDSKWLAVSKQLASKKLGGEYSVFNKDKEPFKSFLALKRIREENLVHWKAEESEPSMTKYGLLDPIIAVFDAGKAQWACDTGKQ